MEEGSERTDCQQLLGFVRSSMAFGILVFLRKQYTVSGQGIWAMYDGSNGSRHTIVFGIKP